MKKLYSISLFLLFILYITGCTNEADIKVTNNIKNVRLESISYGKVPIGRSLLPGESATELLSDQMDGVKFPMSECLTFYMAVGGNKVLLYTKEKFPINKNDFLSIILTDETEVVNPMTKSSGKERITISDILVFD